MSGRLRVVLALLIVCGAALFVYALGAPATPPFLPPPSNGGTDVAAVGSEAKPGVLQVDATPCVRSQTRPIPGNTRRRAITVRVASVSVISE